ncbi:dihydrolipoyl dehydrogenase [Gottschalkiaceae bacterium SANA]|nr:dihydrolipoyl dehydrogenase [Gottschalkiaceae bacterium SANA]
MYDIIVIGAGPGGYVAAIKAAQLGANVALIEKEAYGGVCLNWGCIPTKTLLKSAKIYQEFLHAEDYGIVIDDQSNIQLDWTRIQKRKNQVVKKMTNGVRTLLKKNGVTLYKGFAEVVNSGSVRVNEETLVTKKIILALGSHPHLPEIPGLNTAYQDGFVKTSRELLDLKEIPKSLIIIGGGVVGIEFATLFQALGSQVTMLQRSDRILAKQDYDVRVLLEKVLKKSGVEIVYHTKIHSIDQNMITGDTSGTPVTFTGEQILFSIGRIANTKGIESLNLKMEKGKIQVSDTMETSIPGIYAIGDMNGKAMLAHVASAEGIIAAENAVLGSSRPLNYKKAPACIYSFPEVGSVGYTEEEAKKEGRSIKIGRFPLAANGKAMAEGHTTGFVKLIADKDSYDEIIGIHIVAPNATDMIAQAVATMELEGTLQDLAHAIHPHPSISEAVMEAAHGGMDRPIHIYKKKEQE